MEVRSAGPGSGRGGGVLFGFGLLGAKAQLYKGPREHTCELPTVGALASPHDLSELESP